MAPSLLLYADIVEELFSEGRQKGELWFIGNEEELNQIKKSLRPTSVKIKTQDSVGDAILNVTKDNCIGKLLVIGTSKWPSQNIYLPPGFNTSSRKYPLVISQNAFNHLKLFKTAKWNRSPVLINFCLDNHIFWLPFNDSSASGTNEGTLRLKDRIRQLNGCVVNSASKAEYVILNEPLSRGDAYVLLRLTEQRLHDATLRRKTDQASKVRYLGDKFIQWLSLQPTHHANLPNGSSSCQLMFQKCRAHTLENLSFIIPYDNHDDIAKEIVAKGGRITEIPRAGTIILLYTKQELSDGLDMDVLKAAHTQDVIFLDIDWMRGFDIQMDSSETGDQNDHKSYQDLFLSSPLPLPSVFKLSRLTGVKVFREELDSEEVNKKTDELINELDGTIVDSKDDCDLYITPTIVTTTSNEETLQLKTLRGNENRQMYNRLVLFDLKCKKTNYMAPIHYFYNTHILRVNEGWNAPFAGQIFKIVSDNNTENQFLLEAIEKLGGVYKDFYDGTMQGITIIYDGGTDENCRSYVQKAISNGLAVLKKGYVIDQIGSSQPIEKLPYQLTLSDEIFNTTTDPEVSFTATQIAHYLEDCNIRSQPPSQTQKIMNSSGNFPYDSNDEGIDWSEIKSPTSQKRLSSDRDEPCSKRSRLNIQGKSNPEIPHSSSEIVRLGLGEAICSLSTYWINWKKQFGHSLSKSFSQFGLLGSLNLRIECMSHDLRVCNDVRIATPPLIDAGTGIITYLAYNPSDPTKCAIVAGVHQSQDVDGASVAATEILCLMLDILVNQYGFAGLSKKIESRTIVDARGKTHFAVELGENFQIFFHLFYSIFDLFQPMQHHLSQIATYQVVVNCSRHSCICSSMEKRLQLLSNLGQEGLRVRISHTIDEIEAVGQEHTPLLLKIDNDNCKQFTYILRPSLETGTCTLESVAKKLKDNDSDILSKCHVATSSN